MLIKPHLELLYRIGVGIYDEPLLYLVWYTTIVIFSIIAIGMLSTKIPILSATSTFWDCKVSFNESTDEAAPLLEINLLSVASLTLYWQTVWTLKVPFF